MLITRTVTKKILEKIVHETFSNFGVLTSSSLLDSLKLLGFYYATNAGISINIEDLKTPNIKRNIIENANKEIDQISQLWQEGYVSDIERFQSIIDSWNIATESLKNKIVDYYQIFDPANNLYIMAFSGARGNMSQVRQLVGMRGLMSDQEGNIIDLPIQANFREGLSSIDYIISSYGARKGIVDTALKTADSGYLTRRLIYIGQDLIIREIECLKPEGVIILLKKKTNVNNIIGRTLISARLQNYPYSVLFEESKIVDEKFLKSLKELGPVILNVRSSLTCNSNGSICQKCYGWDLAKERLISLGETVGIIAAQSIGEPGTQLTMRTFHTGGIFTSETLQQIRAPFSGKLILPPLLKTVSYRTSHGKNVLKLQQEINLVILNWQGIEENVFLEIGSFLYVKSSCFIKKGDLIAECSNQSILAGARRLKPVYTSLAGEIRFENLLIRKIVQNQNQKEKEKNSRKEDPHKDRIIKINQENSVLWLASGKIFPLPKEVNYKFPNRLKEEKSFASLKVITPMSGIILLENNTISILTRKKRIIINLISLKQTLKNCLMKIFPLTSNYQYVDAFTILAKIEIFPQYSELIYSVRKKDSKEISTFFLITESDVWKTNSDQVNNFSFFQDKKVIVRSGNLLNNNSKFSRSGFFLKKDGFKMIFQNAIPIFLSRGTILNYKQGDFVLENKVFATLINYRQQTEDIVQGLPKIEELIEVRHPKIKASLSLRPGIILNSKHYETELINSSIIKRVCLKEYVLASEKLNENSKMDKNTSKKKTNTVLIGHSFYQKNEMTVYKNRIFQAFPIPDIHLPCFVESKKRGSIAKYHFINQENENSLEKSLLETKNQELKDILENTIGARKPKDFVFLIDGALEKSHWYAQNMEEAEIYKYKNNSLEKWITLNNSSNIFSNLRGDFIVKTNGFGFICLKEMNDILSYEIPLTSKLLPNPGEFIDIGEPITEGTIDLHELLSIFFEYHLILDGRKNGTIRSLYKFQLLLVNSIQSIYQSQGVNISSKHIEIVVRQMTAKVVIKESGDTPLLPGEIIKLSLMNAIFESFNSENGNRAPKYEPLLVSATTSSVSKDGFLSAAGFQETKRVLTRAALEGSYDWLRGLKESIMIGRLIPGGSSFLNYKSYLDNIYSLKT